MIIVLLLLLSRSSLGRVSKRGLERMSRLCLEGGLLPGEGWRDVLANVGAGLRGTAASPSFGPMSLNLKSDVTTISGPLSVSVHDFPVRQCIAVGLLLMKTSARPLPYQCFEDLG